MAVAPRFLRPPSPAGADPGVEFGGGAWTSAECEPRGLVFRFGGYVEKARELRHKGAERDKVLRGCHPPLANGPDHGATEDAGVEKAGVDSRGGKCGSKLYGTPNQDCIEKILSYV